MHRYRSQARIHASARFASNSTEEDLVPSSELTTHPDSWNTQAGGQSIDSNGSGVPHGDPPVDDTVYTHGKQPTLGDAATTYSSSSYAEKTSADGPTSPKSPVTASPPHKSEDAISGDSTIEANAQQNTSKPTILNRMIAGSKRFGIHLKNALFHSWINVLLIAVPVGIAAEAAGLQPAIVFAVNAVAIIPLAGLLAHATESVASRLGDTLGALLNVSFGNAVELIIFIIALVKNQIPIVQASILGSILANLLLILGMAFLLGGLRYREQVYNNTVTQMSACLLSLSVVSLLLPTAFHAAFNDSSAAQANTNVLKVSRGTSVVLLIVYVLYLLFQLKSHAYMYESTPQEIIDEESHPGVLADIMNSSSSSEDDSDSDSSDSSASGSIVATSRRVKRMFRNRKRRKSSGTASSVVTSPSIISTPSVEHNEYPWVHQSRNNTSSRRASVTADDNEAEPNQNGTTPRIRDFGDQQPENREAKSPELKKHRKLKHYKKSLTHKHHHRHARNDAMDQKALPANSTSEMKQTEIEGGPKVGFAEEVQVVPDQPSGSQELSQSRLTFNMRQISSRNVFRPALPKMLSNNVFVQPAPTAIPNARQAPTRVQSSVVGLRRTSSLPEFPTPGPPVQNASQVTRTDPLPPYQHQRLQMKPEGTDANSEHEKQQPEMSRTAAIVLLLCTTVLVAICAEFLVDAIPDLVATSNVSQAFIGLIILPIVGNAAEHVTAVTVAAKNKMDLAIGVAVGSSIQIALFVTPIIVLLGWILNKDMTLYFNIFDTVSLFVTAFVVNFLILDGRSNYLEGSLLIAAYVIIALGAFFYPSQGAQSDIGSGGP